MKKLATATIATAGIATIAFTGQDADAAESNNQSSYNYSYTIDQNGNYNYDWQGNGNDGYSYTYTIDQNGNYNYDWQGTPVNNKQSAQSSNQTSTQSYTSNNTGGKGAKPASTTSDRSYHVNTESAPSNGGQSLSQASGSGNNTYTEGQCTYYVYDRVGGKIGQTWGDASNWANAAAQDGYSVDNSPKSGSILQSTAGSHGHVAYVENVNNDGSVEVSEMNYGHGPGVVSQRTISADEASSYNYIH